MKVKQISVFIENRKGRLREVTEILANASINIRALSLADTALFGILRFISDRHEEACKVLHDAKFSVKETEVVAVEIKDEPGGLYRVLKILEDGELNVEYMYAFTERHKENAVLIFRIEEIDRGIQTLQSNGFNLLSNDDLKTL